MRRRGRPGLLGTVGRTALIAGTASATVNAVNRRADERGAATPVAAMPPTPPLEPGAAPAEQDLVTQLSELGRLREAGLLSSDEFGAAKARLLER